MKIVLQHHHHRPSSSFNALLSKCLESLRGTRQIDEARIRVEHRLEASPAFRVTAHLVTPGPDVFADAVDHTLRAALQKAMAQLADRIELRQLKRARRAQRPFRTSIPAASAGPARA